MPARPGRSSVRTEAAAATNAFLFDASGSNWYLGGTTGVCRSSDAGKTWQVAAVGNGESVQALVLDPLNASTLYAGTAPGSFLGVGSVFRSLDGGQTWEALGTGFTPVPVSALAIGGAGKTLHAATRGGGVAELTLVTDRQAVHAAPAGRRTGVVTPRP